MSAFSALWLGWSLSLFGALSWGLLFQHGHAVAVSGRMASSVLLVVAAGLAWQRSVRMPGRLPYAAFITVGMAGGTLGDLFNAGLFGPGLTTLAAMVAFGVGHVFYITGTVRELARCRPAPGAVAGPLIGWLAAGAVGWWLVVLEAPVDPGTAPLVWPALGYCLLLAGTAGVGTALGLADSRFGALALGAALFLLSDMILAVEIFRGDFPQDTLAVWLPYGCGQMLIVLSAVRTADRDPSGGSPRIHRKEPE